MKKFLMMMSLVSMVVFMASPAEATCYQGGGGFAGAAQHTYDWQFEDLGGGTCNAWKTTGTAAAEYEADSCGSNMSGYNMVLEGDINGATPSFYQDIDLDGFDTDNAWLDFFVDLRGSMTTFDYVKVTIRDPSDNSWLETLGLIRGTSTSLDCTMVSYDVSGDYENQEIRIHFQGYLIGGASTAFIFDAVRFFTY